MSDPTLPKPKPASIFHWSKRYAKETTVDAINMKLIGGWSDLAAYYEGSDGNAWSHQSGRWSNCGPVEEFKALVKAGQRRGELIET